MSVGSHRRARLTDASQVRRRHPSPISPRDWRVRTKLAAALVVPSLAFLVLAGMRTADVVSGATVLDEFAGQVRLARETAALVHELQEERDRTIGELAALGPSATPDRISTRLSEVMPPIQESVDAHVAAFRKAAGRPGGSTAWRSAISAANAQLNLLGRLRAGTYSGILPSATVSENYTRAVDALLNVLVRPSPGEGREELNRAVLAYVELAKAKEINSLLRARLFAVASAGKLFGDERAELSDLRSQLLAALAQFRVAASEEQVQLYDRTLSAPNAQRAGKLANDAIDDAIEGRVELEPRHWWALSTGEHNLIREVERKLVNDAASRADSASAAQWRQTALVTGLVLFVLLAAIVASVAIGRSMAHSLRQLREQALTVAHTQLPELLGRLRQLGPRDPVTDTDDEPIVVSADEIGDVAEAFHAVHRSAVHLAVEQATMRRNVNAIFVNLARRSQVLVERQLELLDRMEHAETNPELLTNLFNLDHLAARMRRNDDNLLVLAGSESRRRWTEPVALSAVVVAAAAEIEQYQRVRHEVGSQLYLVGRVVGDLAHLLAELLENASQFSPPESFVLVTASRAPGGHAAVIEIVDSGMGMTQPALAEANQTLATPPPVDVAAAERMGLVVVSHLAARHGAQVRLERTPADPRKGAPGGGLTASVWLPPELLAPAPAVPELVSASVPGLSGRIVQAQGNGSAGRPTAVNAAELPASRGAAVRAEDVLGAGDRTAWWSRPDLGVAAEPLRSAGRLPEGPPEVPVTGGTNELGLPLRVPMAQLPRQEATGSDGSSAGGASGPTSGRQDVRKWHVELDPELVGGGLARFYRGVRQAQSEDEVVPVFRTGEGQPTTERPSGTAVAQEQQYEEE